MKKIIAWLKDEEFESEIKRQEWKDKYLGD